MPLLAPLQPLFDMINTPHEPPPGTLTAQLRKMTHTALEQVIVAFYDDVPPLALERDHEVPVAGGTITLRTYAPDNAVAPLPCHLYFHGGGFWLGKLDHFDALCRGFARDARCMVASVDYRLSPEHKFPAPAEDSYTALLWLRANAVGLGVDPLRISVGGVSAGGNLAAVVSLMARDRSVPAPVLQVLEVPVLDLSDWSPLSIAAEGVVLPSGKDVYCAHYLAEDDQATLPYVSPLRASDLAGLPPALILCAEYDALVSEGAAYAERLRAAGVAVEHHVCEGQFHGAQPMAKLIPEEAAAYQAIIVAALRRAYGTSGGE